MNYAIHYSVSEEFDSIHIYLKLIWCSLCNDVMILAIKYMYVENFPHKAAYKNPNFYVKELFKSSSEALRKKKETLLITLYLLIVT